MADGLPTTLPYLLKEAELAAPLLFCFFLFACLPRIQLVLAVFVQRAGWCCYFEVVCSYLYFVRSFSHTFLSQRAFVRRSIILCISIRLST